MKYALTLCMILLFSANTSAQITPYEAWRFSVQTYYPGQNFSTFGPTQRFNNGYTVFQANQSFVQPTKSSPGHTTFYLTKPRNNQFGHYVYPPAPKTQSQGRRK